MVKAKAEDARVAMRNHRRSARQELEQMEKDGLSSDDLERAEKGLDKITQGAVDNVDELTAHKEKELLEV